MLLVLLLPGFAASAQQERAPYTGSNRIFIALEGPTSRYEFSSNQMLVRHNKATQKLECILPVATLLPLNDSIPPAMAFEVLFGAKYPQLYINIDAPVQKISAGNLTPETIRRTTSIGLQGVNNETVVPVAFTSENNSLYFSTSFDLMLDNFQASLPIEYAPLLTGRILISIDNARWINLEMR
ncbi:hypothetical protein CA264_07260 [Pontibacter actiniarum]|uniref:Lipid/polyisoprenoid-binding YceI-like domain-containing protein n=1 Tax=Pontibacter actiniarum TaxID=323450 RepID=A0A1X9YQW0_9BACT|nr:hypothetical protein CA264_07260 [Pontibacter actiniarum]